jgi:hypothetical protein
MGRGVTA